MIKTLVVSGCSFTMGGGLDNPNYHKYFETLRLGNRIRIHKPVSYDVNSINRRITHETE